MRLMRLAANVFSGGLGLDWASPRGWGERYESVALMPPRIQNASGVKAERNVCLSSAAGIVRRVMLAIVLLRGSRSCRIAKPSFSDFPVN